MQRTGATETAANVLRNVFPVVLLLCLGVSGCGKICFSGFFNGSASGITVSNSSCPLIKATGAVIVQLSTACPLLRRPSHCHAPHQARHQAMSSTFLSRFAALRPIQTRSQKRIRLPGKNLLLTCRRIRYS